MEALGSEWDGGTCHETPKGSILKIRLKKEQRIHEILTQWRPKFKPCLYHSLSDPYMS